MQGFLQPKQADSTPTSPAGEVRSSGVLLPAISHLGLPAAVFGGVFLVLTVVLIALTSPDRFPVRIGDKIVRLSTLEAEAQSLHERETAIQREREALKNESSAPVLHDVLRLREDMYPVGRALLAIDGVRRGFATAAADPISLPTVLISGSGGMITLGGEVRDENGRSMQLLASFVDGLRALPMAKTVTEPEYREIGTQDGVSVSPFRITITLLHD